MKQISIKLLSLLMTMSLALGFTACGDDDAPTSTQKPTDPTDPKDPEDPTDPEDTQTNIVGWPADYGGVMLQAFYWDGFADAQWATLESQAENLATTFDLVWIPQSANCGGQSMGYDDLYWSSNYNSPFGTGDELKSMMAT